MANAAELCTRHAITARTITELHTSSYIAFKVNWTLRGSNSHCRSIRAGDAAAGHLGIVPVHLTRHCIGRVGGVGGKGDTARTQEFHDAVRS